MSRLTMRRELWEVDRSTKPKVSKTPVRFFDVQVGGLFYLQDPEVYICLTFIKTGVRSAELYTWDDNAPKQYFPVDYLVYKQEPVLKPKNPGTVP